MLDTTMIKNQKFFKGSFKNFKSTKGWFVGSFFDENDPLKTDKIEAMYCDHKAGDIQTAHYHKDKVELLLLIEGKAIYKINDKKVMLRSGDFLFIDVKNIIQGKFIKDSKFFAIHSPSLPKDKYLPK